MFFSISTKGFDDRFFNQQKVNNYYISLDNGWNYKSDNDCVFLYKGYSDIGLDAVIDQFSIDYSPKYDGNFCIIVVTKNKLVITHSQYRSFELYHGNSLITNFYKSELETPNVVYADRYLEIEKKEIKQIKCKKVYPNLNFKEKLSLNECKTEIFKILKDKIKQLKNFKQPINVYLSGGVDTLLVYSLIELYYGKNSVNYNLLAQEHLELSKFVLKNYQKLIADDNVGLYNQIHHWKTPAVLASGANGDSVFMSSPRIAAIWLAWNNINIVEILNQDNHYYCKKYYLRAENKKIFDQYWADRHSIQKLSYNKLCMQIMDISLNDHQHWHLENTIMWTPLLDLKILSCILRLSKEDILEQILNRSLAKSLLDNVNKELKSYISTHRSHNQYENLTKFDEYLLYSK